MEPSGLVQHALHGSLEYAACRVVMSALMKLASGSPTFSHELNVDAFLRQVGLAEGQHKAGSPLQAVSNLLTSSSSSLKHSDCLFAEAPIISALILGLPARMSASSRLCHAACWLSRRSHPVGSNCRLATTGALTVAPKLVCLPFTW